MRPFDLVRLRSRQVAQEMRAKNGRRTQYDIRNTHDGNAAAGQERKTKPCSAERKARQVAISGSFDQATISRVMQANDIVDLISEHISLKKKGREMVGLCPFHEDHRPSMYVNPAKQIFKCFACGAGGGVFTFVQMREKLTFPQAVERLAERAGIKLAPAKFPADAKHQSQEIDPNQMAKVNAWAAKHFRQNLRDEKKGKFARDYIAQRQITAESCEKWGLGLAGEGGDELLRAASQQKIPPRVLQLAGLVTLQNQDKFINRLMFPITDVTGRIIGFGGRALQQQQDAKYVNSPATPLFDKSNCLYGLEQARRQIAAAETTIVVEGYTDCIMAHQFGCTNVVATLGTSLTAGHGRILRRYAKKVIVIFDSDTAGLEAANRALDVCLSQRIDVYLASVPQGKDPCDFLLTGGKEGFDKLAAEAVDVLQFKWDRLTESFGNDNTLTGRKAALDELLQTIAIGLHAGNLAAIDTGLLVNRLSGIIGLDSRQINAELSKRVKRAAKTAGYTSSGGQETHSKVFDMGQSLSAAAQREVLEILLNEPKLFEIVKGKTTTEVFDVPILRQIADIVFETLGSNSNAGLEAVLIKAESAGLGGFVADLTHAGEQKANFEPRLAGALETLQQCQARNEKDRARQAEDQTDYLRCVYRHAGKQNPHNIGMIQ